MLKRKLAEIGSAVYRSLIFPFRKMKLELSTNSIIKQHAYLCKHTVLCGRNYIGKNVFLKNVHVGFGSYINNQCNFTNTVIGKYTSIGTDVTCLLGKHPTEKIVAMHPAFYSKDAAMGYTYTRQTIFEESVFLDQDRKIQIAIGNDVWIGNHVRIAEGVTIHDGAVIGAGSLVLNDVEPYGVYAGVPAKKIRSRFSDDQIAALLSCQWWQKDEEWIRTHIKEFADIEIFMKNHSKG
ncbi:MAG: CatB-related O-acetyltransferase [Clostridia bacterium]|nr:CatB-related O-acetyltransferase [Clostridia bacterium]